MDGLFIYVITGHNCHFLKPRQIISEKKKEYNHYVESSKKYKNIPTKITLKKNDLTFIAFIEGCKLLSS